MLDPQNNEIKVGSLVIIDSSSLYKSMYDPIFFKEVGKVAKLESPHSVAITFKHKKSTITPTCIFWLAPCQIQVIL